MSATIKDIQRETGLSLSTISKYINGGTVREKNKIKLDQAIKKLNFKANHFAQGLRTNRSSTIGVLLPDLDTPFFSSIISHMENDFRDSGYGMIVSSCYGSPEFGQEALSFLISKRIDGLIVFPPSVDSKFIQMCTDENIPVVLLDQIVKDYETDAVVINNRTVSKEMTEECIRLGHKHIGLIIGSTSGSFTMRKRYDGYADALAAANIPFDPNLVAASIHVSISDGYNGFKKIISAAPYCTVIYCTNYDTTLGALFAINDLGYTVGKDISLCGFDGMDLVNVVKPRLTVVNQPIREMASKAASLLINKIAAGSAQDAYSIITLQAEICRGDSIRDLRDSS